MTSNADHQAAWRERQRGGPPRTPTPCPSWQAASRHQRNPDDVCADPEGCALALRDYNRAAKQRSRKNQT